MNLLRSLIVSLILISCGGFKNIPVSSEIYTNKWILEAKPPFLREDNIYLIFNKKKSNFIGFTGCNSISGEYIINKGFIKFYKIFSTKKSCTKNYNNEFIFLSLLQLSNQIRIKQNKLFLYKERKLLLRFKKTNL